ncbi:hypothetical protein SNEBB_000531 [Seison nebaliae]|nr:hypothetical protein SNEBB_000531 [Seison nebaliae]
MSKAKGTETVNNQTIPSNESETEEGTEDGSLSDNEGQIGEDEILRRPPTPPALVNFAKTIAKVRSRPKRYIDNRDNQDERTSDTGRFDLTYYHQPNEDDILNRPNLKLQNTYQIVSGWDLRLGSIFDDIVKAVGIQFAGRRYNSTDSPSRAIECISLLKEFITPKIDDRYKIVFIVSVGEVKSQLIRFGSRCLWSLESDKRVEYKFTLRDLWVCVVCFFIYRP